MKKNLVIVASALIVIGIFYFFFQGKAQKINREIEKINTKTENLTCITKTEIRTVRGNSLFPLLKSGDKVKILFGYYNCNKVNRNDIIAYNYSGDKNPLIKIVKGLPGDKISLKKAENNWHILINDKIILNSEGKPYVLNEKEYKLLSLYVKDYQGIIPENSYLILGNLETNSLDSRSFGLVDKKDIMGKLFS